MSSYAFPRTSIDLDLVVAVKKAPRARAVLKEGAFALGRSRVIHGGRYVGAFEPWRHDSGARVDLLVGGVQDRKIGVWMPHAYLAAGSRPREVRAFFAAPPVRCAVASPELLIALKLQPFRLVDRRDIFALCFEPPDAAGLRRHLDWIQDARLAKRLGQMPDVVGARAFEDSFKGVYRIASDRVVARLRRNLVALVRDALAD